MGVGLRVAVLGPPRIEVDGAPLEVDTRKAVALLAHLAVGDGARSRESLATLLWPDSDRDRARASLRRTLSALNGALGGRWLVVDRASLTLTDEDVWADVRAFRGATRGAEHHGHPDLASCETCLGRLEEAVDLYRDDFLAGFGLRDSAAFDDWQQQVAAELRREVTSALDRLVTARVSRGEFDAAAVQADRRLAIDPLHEPTHRQLVLLHAWSGRRAEAIRQYERCRELLDQELGLPPLEETTAVYDAVRADRPPPPPASAGAGARGPAPARTAAWLVGRDDEVRALTEACAGGGRVLAVEGEAGIGLTAVLEAVAAAVRARGAPVVSVRGRETERGLAYGVAAEVVREVVAAGADATGSVAAEWLAETARIAPELLERHPEVAPAPTLDAPETRRRLLEGIRRTLLGGLAGPTPGVLVVDDVHWTDDASIDALLYVAGRLDAASCSVVLAWHTEALPQDHRLRRLVHDLASRGLAEHRVLGRLDAPAVAALVAASGHADPDGAIAARLHRETGGLPLLVAGFLRDLPGDGPTEQGTWRVPADAREMLRSRVGAVSSAARELAVTAAVFARPLDLDTLFDAGAVGGTTAVAALEELLRAGILVEHLDGGSVPTYDFALPALRSLVYEDASLARRRLVHGRVADVLQGAASAPTPAGLAAVARHLRLAGRDREAAAAYVEAATAARQVVALDEAIEHVRAALALGYEPSGQLHELLGELETRRGDYAAATRALRTAADALAEPADRARLALRLAGISQRRGDWDAAEERLRAGLDLVPAEAAGLAATLRAELAVTLERQGRGEEARDLAEQALALAETAADSRALVVAHNTLGMVARAAGCLDEAASHLQMATDLADDLGDPAAAVAALNNLSLTCADRGERGRALELAKTALARCRRGGDRHHEAALLNNLADLLHAAGRREEARSHVEQAVALFAEVGRPDRLEPEIWKLVDW